MDHKVFVRVFRPFFLSACAAVSAWAQSQSTVPNNVAPWVGKAKITGPSNPNGRVVVSVYLNLRNEADLQALIHDLYTPGSAHYRKFLTPEEFRAAYSPSATDVSAVQAFLSKKGLKVVYTPANAMYVDASGTVSQIASAFSVSQNQYDYKGKNLRANAEAPSIPSSLAGVISFVGGLDESYALIRPYINTGDPSAAPGFGYATPGPCSTFWGDQQATLTPAAYQYGSVLPWVPCGYTPAQIRVAYGADRVAQTGSGVRVGITDAFASPTIVDDVNRFSVNHGLPLLNSSNFQQISVPGTTNFPENRFDPQGWYGEESLDIEWVHAIAPGAAIIFAGAQNSSQPLDHALIHLIDHHLADVITNSWGSIGDLLNFGHVQADERAFMQAAAEGISVLFSSGDDGDVAALTGIAQGSWPATSPYVTAVGGTSLAILNASGSKREWGWGTYRTVVSNAAISGDGTMVTGTGFAAWPPPFLYGSSGGISFHFLQPAYQQGIVPNALATATVDSNGNVISFPAPHRVAPDVAMDGDPNTGALYGQSYNISGDPLIDAGCTVLSKTLEYCERRIGGTSLSSPMFAGVLALANQARLDAGKAVIGFANPQLYSLSGAALVDVLPPSSPLALLRNIEGTAGLTTTFRTINSVPPGTQGKVIEGADTSLLTQRGWDDVTGLGTPYVPSLVTAIQSLP